MSRLRRREVGIVLCWAAGIASVFAQAFYQRAGLSPADHVLVFAICVLAGAIISDVGYALLGYVAALTIGVGSIFVISIVPIQSGNFTLLATELLSQVWVNVIFNALFPFGFVGYLVGAVIGSALGEIYIY